MTTNAWRRGEHRARSRANAAGSESPHPLVFGEVNRTGTRTRAASAGKSGRGQYWSLRPRTAHPVAEFVIPVSTLGRIQVRRLPEQRRVSPAGRCVAVADFMNSAVAASYAGRCRPIRFRAGACSPLVGGHPHRELAAGGMAEHEQPGAAGVGAEDVVDRAVSQRDALSGRSSLGVRAPSCRIPDGRAPHRVTRARRRAQQGQSRMARAVEVRRGARPAVESDDDGARIGGLGEQAGHRHAVDEDDAGTGAARSPVRPQQDHAAGCQTAATDHGDARVRRPGARRPRRATGSPPRGSGPCRGCGLRQLAAVGVQRYHAVAGDVLPAVEEVLGLADAAEAERLDPGQAVE